MVAPGHGRIADELDRGALLIAAALDPQVDVDHELQRLDALAASLASTTAADLAVALFGGVDPDPDRHFLGNPHDYYDPENSRLDRVLDRRLGIPITLSVLMIEVGRRLAISLHGVGMPGHFLVGSADGFIDPFHGGRLLDRHACEARFVEMAGRDAQLPDGALDRTPPAAILQRMLANLAIIATQRELRRLLWATRSLLACFPHADHRDHVQHAYAAAGVGQFAEAATAGEVALSSVPPSVRDKLMVQIVEWRARLN